jgi:hypothetical protein
MMPTTSESTGDHKKVSRSTSMHLNSTPEEGSMATTMVIMRTALIRRTMTSTGNRMATLATISPSDPQGTYRAKILTQMVNQIKITQ